MRPFDLHSFLQFLEATPHKWLVGIPQKCRKAEHLRRGCNLFALRRYNLHQLFVYPSPHLKINK